MNDGVCKLLIPWIYRCSAGNLRLGGLSILVALSMLAVPHARCQEAETAVAARIPLGVDTPTEIQSGVTKSAPVKRPVEQEIYVSGMIPDGDYRMISTTIRCDAWTVGVEYDRHSWGYLLRAQMDYVTEVIPFVLLSEPAKADFWGNPESPYQQHLYGVTVVPFGFRMLWRGNRPLKFYLSSKVGVSAFNQKALSLNASYANINVQAAFGVQYRLSDRIDLRLEPFEFFHVSNGYLAASNPGMDELGTKYGISYHLGRRGSR